MAPSHDIITSQRIASRWGWERVRRASYMTVQSISENIISKLEQILAFHIFIILAYIFHNTWQICMYICMVGATSINERCALRNFTPNPNPSPCTPAHLSKKLSYHALTELNIFTFRSCFTLTEWTAAQSSGGSGGHDSGSWVVCVCVCAVLTRGLCDEFKSHKYTISYH